MIGFFTKLLTGGSLWKIMTGLAGVTTLVMGGFLIHSYFDNRSLTNQRNALSKEINDPKTGYVAQLFQARTNVSTLRVAIDEQNKAYHTLSEASKKALADSERRLAEAQKRTKLAEQRVSRFMATGPKGDSLEDRIRDIDDRAMKEFVK